MARGDKVKGISHEHHDDLQLLAGYLNFGTQAGREAPAVPKGVPLT